MSGRGKTVVAKDPAKHQEVRELDSELLEHSYDRYFATVSLIKGAFCVKCNQESIPPAEGRNYRGDEGVSEVFTCISCGHKATSYKRHETIRREYPDIHNLITDDTEHLEPDYLIANSNRPVEQVKSEVDL